MSGLIEFAKNLLSDIKSSRRFQVATVLWIPLLVSTIILLVRLGERNYIEAKYHQWKATYIPESYIQFPHILFWSANNNITGAAAPSCFQYNNPTKVVYPQAQPCPDSRFGAMCWVIDLTSYQSSGLDVYSYAVNCTFNFVGAPDQENIMLITLHGGFVTMTGGWNQDWVPLRPNNAIAVHLEPRIFHPLGQQMVREWRVRHHYETTIFPSYITPSTATYSTSLVFRIPFTVVATYWETVPFDSWMLIAFWGGGIFFFFLLHVAAFSIASFFLPHDSKILGSSAGAQEFTQIK